jgi:hypothetical protein
VKTFCKLLKMLISWPKLFRKFDPKIILIVKNFSLLNILKFVSTKPDRNITEQRVFFLYENVVQGQNPSPHPPKENVRNLNSFGLKSEGVNLVADCSELT